MSPVVILCATFTPFACLTHLCRFALNTCVPPDLSDADLATIASWWPEIEELTCGRVPSSLSTCQQTLPCGCVLLPPPV
jgi:hypothetical protein